MGYVPLIVKVFEALEAHGFLDQSHQLGSNSAFPGLFWAGQTDMEPHGITAFTLRLAIKFILACSWEKLMSCPTLKGGCFRCLLVGLLVNFSLHSGLEYLTGLPIGPFETHCPLRVLLGHVDHTFPGAIVSLHLLAVSGLAPDRECLVLKWAYSRFQMRSTVRRSFG